MAYEKRLFSTFNLEIMSVKIGQHHSELKDAYHDNMHLLPMPSLIFPYHAMVSSLRERMYLCKGLSPSNRRFLRSSS